MSAHNRDRPDSLLASKRQCQYDSIPSTETTETSPLFVRHHDDSGGEAMMMETFRNTDGILPSRRKHRGCSRVAIIFGSVVFVGSLVWLGTYAFALTQDGDYYNDDDSFSYEKTLADILPVPLLGRSKSYKAQEEANHAKDLLNMDHAKGHKKSREHLLAYSGNDGHDSGAKEGCEGTVIVLRHCEKGHIREHCNYLGYERSVYLASLFGNDATTRWPAPSYLFAEEPGMRRNPNKRNFRELETILPLSEKFNITVDTSYSSLDSKSLARRIHGLFQSGEMCGKLLVLSWKHSKLPRLAHALGCGPKDGCPTRYHGQQFDELWQLKFVYQTPLHSEHRSLKAPLGHRWVVYGSTQPEGFDPLAFSKIVGDYPQGGTKTGGRWRALDHEIPERDVIEKKKKKNKKKW